MQGGCVGVIYSIAKLKKQKNCSTKVVFLYRSCRVSFRGGRGGAFEFGLPPLEFGLPP